jgi:predicted RNase H-like HicB family nuclease
VEVTDERKSYTASCTRTGNWWAIEVPEVPGVFSQSKRLDGAEAQARDAIALMLEVPEDSFDVTIEAVLPAMAEEALAKVEEVKAEADEAMAAVRLAMVTALLALVDQLGLSYRDAGQVMGISHQRVQQILKDAA